MMDSIYDSNDLGIDPFDKEIISFDYDQDYLSHDYSELFDETQHPGNSLQNDDSAPDLVAFSENDNENLIDPAIYEGSPKDINLPLLCYSPDNSQDTRRSLGRGEAQRLTPPEAHIITQSSSQQRRFRYSELEWDRMKHVIVEYWRRGENTCEIVRLLKQEHGFRASESSLKRRIKSWRLMKNLPKDVAIFMSENKKQREAEGKETSYRYYGNSVPARQYTDAAKRAGKNHVQKSSAQNIPDHVSVITPNRANSQRSETHYPLPNTDACTGDMDIQAAKQVGIVNDGLRARVLSHGVHENQIADELDAMDLPDLYALLESYQSPEEDTSKLKILETICPKLNDADARGARGSITDIERLKYSVVYARTLLSVGKFWLSNQILVGCQEMINFGDLPFCPEKINQVRKLQLLAEIGEKLHQPARPERIEKLSLEVASTESKEVNKNLIFAYLLRLYVINDTWMPDSAGPKNFSEIEKYIDSQIQSTNQTPISFIWLSHQYCRFHLKRKDVKAASGILKMVGDITEKGWGVGAVEAKQNKSLRQLCNEMANYAKKGVGKSKLEYLIYETTEADKVWLPKFKEYLWDHSKTDCTQRRKDKDISFRS